MTSINRDDTWDYRFLMLARHISAWSKDPSTKVGAVISDPYHRIVSLGFNGFPRGVPDLTDHYNDRETKYRMTLHAEANALSFTRSDVRGAYIYIWPTPPCAQCAAKIIQHGLARVVFKKPSMEFVSRWGKDVETAQYMFDNAGITYYQMDTINGDQERE